jgi:hypothetical protein
MKKIVGGLVLAAGVAAVARGGLPELQRYLKIRSM